MSKSIEAWYFATEERMLRYGDCRRIKPGITHKVKANPILCERGLHGSVRIIDALQYAPGPILYRVKLSGEMDVGDDKIAAQCREYLWELDATDILREFARKQALINIRKIKPYCTSEEYNSILQWLQTGAGSLRSAAYSAAYSAAESAARSAAESAAESAARSAAYLAAYLAAYSAARSAAESAARSAARSAAESAARSAAYLAAYLAAYSAADNMLTQMVMNTGWEK